MNKLLLIALIAHVAFAVESDEFHSKKLPPRWSSNVTYQAAPIQWTAIAQKSDRTDEFFEGTFSTRIDHFRPLNQERVDFQFNANVNFFEEGGPIYVYIKDAFDYTTQWIEEGLMVDIARETGAALVTFDQRYFGANRPFDSASFEDLELLTVEQTLADIAAFIRFIRTDIGNSQFQRVILWGSGYGATLAVYARSRYPHLVHAAWSSSAILESAVYSFGPYDMMSYTFYGANDGGQCTALVKNAYDIIAYLVQNGEGEYLAERMNLCHPVATDSPADVAALYENNMRAILYYLDQFHLDGVQAFCRDMGAIYGDPLNSYARWLRYVYGDEECFDSSYATHIERASNTSWDQIGTTTGRRQSYFLQCTQIGSFLVADSYTWLAGAVDVNYHLQKCEDAFGAEFDYTQLTNAFYALDVEFDQALTNIVYTNGILDPLRYFGRTYDTSGLGVVLNIDHSMKSADLTSRTGNDRVSLYEAKTRIMELITEWSDTTE